MKGKQENKMNKKLAFAMPLSLALIACTAQEIPTPKTCVAPKIPWRCVETNKININTNSHNVSPRHICPKTGENIEVKVTPANGDVGSVVTSPKIDDPEHDWLNGTNDPDANGFTLSPPEGSPKGNYDFKVTFSDDYCIDPRISL
jgi:hypothetical protein